MKKSLLLLMSFILVIGLIATGCSAKVEESQAEAVESADTEVVEEASEEPAVVNLYTDRHYDTDQELYDKFEAETGIKVNVVKAKSDELIERLNREGADTEADLLITADAGRLYRAKSMDLLQAVDSQTLNANVPENLRDAEGQWYGLTVRGRVIVYSKDRVTPDQLSTYQALTEDQWKGKVLVRSSSNIYNQSLMASFIELYGEDEALAWAEGLVENMARDPQGNDRDQAKAIVAGEGDVAIMNTYYVGKLLNSSDPEEVKVGEQVAVFMPNQETDGTHINVSGIGLTKHAKQPNNAQLLMEYLSGEEAQGVFAESNYEYPVNPNVEPSELLKSWGEFKAQDLNLSVLGENNADAVKLFDMAGWK